jgi:hypothetical protein
MGISDWLANRRKKKDAEAVERAQAMSLETSEERRITEGHIEGMAADSRVAGRSGEATMDDVGRMGDFPH